MNQQIMEEASAWFIEFRSGSLSGSSQQAFVDWLRRSPDHIRAYLEISESYVRLPQSASVSTQETQRLLGRARARLTAGVVVLNERPGDIVASARPTESSVRRRFRIPRAVLAASVFLIVLSAAITGWIYSRQGLYTTDTAEQRTVILSDGSRIELNAQTRLRVRYDKAERDVELLEGQALFEVAKDRLRPFIVHSVGAQVRAVGTRFDVHRRGSAITVTVLEGTVALTPRASPAQLVSAGHQAIASPDGSAVPQATNVAVATAWTRGQLEFDETPLSEVADDFNRYSVRHLIVESADLRDFRVSGIYSSTDTASLILFLRNQPDLMLTETDREIRVSRAVKAEARRP
jgi:transmembrane sensor